jgi:tRNA-dihydrouridine synthase
MREQTGCAGVMIARGSFGNPWIFAQARALLDGRPRPADPTPAERLEAALEHARLTIAIEGDTLRSAREFRKHLGWYTRGLHGGAELRARLQQVESLAAVERLFEAWTARQAPALAGA